MQDSVRRYVLWVLLPMVLASFTGHILAGREASSLVDGSTHRLGRLGAALVTGEMGLQIANLVREAPALTDPDPDSPLLRAAMTGDTVAGLGMASGEMVLSLALAEEAEDTIRIRATTAPFPAEALGLFRTRTGRGIALYLRGERAGSAPAGFGPESLPGARHAIPGAAPGLPEASALLPLAGSGPSSDNTQLLVAPPGGGVEGLRLWGTGLGALVALGLAGALWALFSGGRKGRFRVIRLLSLTGFPLLVLWFLLAAQTQSVEGGAQELLRGDMVRVLALLKDAGDFVSLDDVPEATGFQALRERNGEILTSTLPPGPQVAALARVPLPPPSFPTVGVLEVGGSELLYAVLREAPGQGLYLSTPHTIPSLERLRLLMALLGGGASLLALGFLLGVPKPAGKGPIP